MGKFLSILFMAFVVSGCSTEKSEFKPDNRSLTQKLEDADKIEPLDIPNGATIGEELLYTMGVDRQSRKMYIISVETNLKVALANNPSLDKAELDEYVTLSMKALEEEMPQFIRDIAEIYEAKFSKDELQLMIDFFTTETGKKYVAGTADLMNSSVVAGENLGQRIQTRTQELLREKRQSEKTELEEEKLNK